jgi:hypothetical protein
MRIEVGPPHGWTVELLDGSKVHVWADGYSRQEQHYTFSNLIDLEAGEQLPDDALAVGENPTNPARMLLAVARFRKDQVLLRDDDQDWPQIYKRPADPARF